MKIDRTKNAKKGIVFGVISNIYTTLIPFVVRTIMLYTLGVQYLGLNSLFSSILQVLNLTELGVGSAMIYSMYKPIAEDDHEKICALMKLYKIYYHIIGFVIFVIGIAIFPILPNMISGYVPEGINIYVLYSIQLASTVLTYWLFAYKNSLLNAFQKRDVLSKIAIGTNTLRFIAQFIALIILRDYYIYVIIMPITQIVNNIFTSFVVDRMYPRYGPRNKLSKVEVKAINQRIKDLFTQKIGNVINNSVDTIVISASLGLTTLAIYQNYYYVLSLPLALGNVIFDSCRAGIGNSIEIESKKKNLNDLRKFTFLIDWIICICSSGLIVLYQDFMVMWTGKDLLFPLPVVILFIVYFYVIILGRLFDVFKDAAGIWHKDRLRPFCVSILNLCSNLIMVRFIGIYGILLSTILSFVVLGFSWELYNLFTCVFDDGLKNYVGMLIKNVFVTIFACIVSWYICFYIPNQEIIWFVVKGIIAVIISNISLVVAYFKTTDFYQAKKLVLQMIRKEK